MHVAARSARGGRWFGVDIRLITLWLTATFSCEKCWLGPRRGHTKQDSRLLAVIAETKHGTYTNVQGYEPHTPSDPMATEVAKGATLDYLAAIKEAVSSVAWSDLA